MLFSDFEHEGGPLSIAKISNIEQCPYVLATFDHCCRLLEIESSESGLY